jgi:hypothetical protein
MSDEKESVKTLVDNWETLFELFFKSSMMQAAIITLTGEKAANHEE